jgi:hypothetical protein
MLLSERVNKLREAFASRSSTRSRVMSFRVAAVSALAKFGAASEDLLPNILVLLQRTMLDQDDEVRDRATFYYQLLRQQDKGLHSAYILNCECDHVE